MSREFERETEREELDRLHGEAMAKVQADKDRAVELLRVFGDPTTTFEWWMKQRGAYLTSQGLPGYCPTCGGDNDVHTDLCKPAGKKR